MLKKDPVILEIATWRMQQLFLLAANRAKKKDDESRRLSRRYLKLLKEISSHYKVRMPNQIKNSICKNCGNLLIPGLNCKVRLASSKGYLVYTCECKEEKHIFYK
ncbi:MAG: ribonuclease P protein component 4 [Candidatus Micrarchaeales archaeon]